MDVAIHWRGSVTDFATDLIQGALSRRDLVALVGELERRGYSAPRGIPWMDGGERLLPGECVVHGDGCHGRPCDYRDGTCTAEPPLPAAAWPEECPPCERTPNGIRCGECAACRVVLARARTTGTACAPTESAAPATIRGPLFSAGHSTIRKLRKLAGSGGDAELSAIYRLEHGTATAVDLERLAPIARDAGLPWESMFGAMRVDEGPSAAELLRDLEDHPDVGGPDVRRKLRESAAAERRPPNPITSVAARDFTLAGPCPELCSCDESAWLRGRLRSVSRRLLAVAELATAGADAVEGASGVARRG